jgi:hypothetical protein
MRTTARIERKKARKNRVWRAPTNLARRHSHYVLLLPFPFCCPFNPFSSVSNRYDVPSGGCGADSRSGLTTPVLLTPR